MTPKISLITATAIAAALVVAAPAAWGQPAPDVFERTVAQTLDTGQPQWKQALIVRSEALNGQYGLGEYAGTRALELRSEALNRQYGLGEYSTSSTTKMLDGRERSFAAKQTVQPTSPIDARERALTEKRGVQLGSAVSPDVFERAVAARESTVDRFIANDDRFRIDPSSNPVPVTVTSSGREIEWPQIGIGFGIGMALILGLVLALRATRHRPLAH